MRRLSLLVAIIGAGLLLASCGRAPQGDAGRTDAAGKATGLPAQSVEVDQVTVTAEPTRIDASGASVRLTLDTHSTPLTMTLPAAATLTVAGRAWRAIAWDGGAAGGHHRAGTVRFLPGGPDAGSVQLTLAGLSRPVIFRWTR